jgi:putative endonuclease
MAVTHAQRRALGDFGERLAVRHLTEQGIAVLDRNWRCRDGEIDIVARSGSTLVVCEVKTRTSTRFGTPLEAITATKADRLHRLGWQWARAHQERFDTLRIDIVTVVLPRRGRRRLEHLTGVG